MVRGLSLFIIGSILVGFSIFSSVKSDEDEINALVDEIMKGIHQMALSPKMQISPDLENALSSLIPKNGRNGPLTWLRDTSTCVACNVVIKTAQIYRRIGGSKKFARDLIVIICKAITHYDDIVCSGLVDLNIDFFIYIFERKPWLTSNTVCGTILQENNCHAIPEIDWKVNLQPGQSPPRPNFNDSQYQKLKVAQITDIHYDPTYEPDSDAECGQPICCSRLNGPPENGKNGSGYWGDYRPCDMPYHSVLNLLGQLAGIEDLSFIYFTGDIISHRVWNTSEVDNAATIKSIYQLFHRYLGEIPIYPILGNHEPNPLNQFSPEEIEYFDPSLSMRWAFNLVAEEWMKWLPKDTQPTIRRGGYYTVLHKPGFRIIGLNSNVCYVYNWWLLYNEIDPYGQLQWLADTLHQAEKDNEFVHILSHIPPGDSTCIKQWGKQFRRIINRYANIIKAQFNGHTHYDELRLFYNLTQPDQVVNVAYNGGSFTTYYQLNPNYRIFEISNQTLDVLDFDEYVFDLDESNTGEFHLPRWFKYYSFKEAFELNTTSLEELQNIPLRMVDNQTLTEQYRRLKYRGSKVLLQKWCDAECYKEIICEIVTSEYGDDTQCEKITQKLRYKTK